MVYYLWQFRNALKRGLVFRSATFVTVLNNIIFGLVRAAVLIGLYTQVGDSIKNGFSINQVIAYTAVSQALIGPLNFWGNWEFAQSIQSGQIATDLSKPASLYLTSMARTLGRAAYELLFSSIPVLLSFAALFSIKGPTSWQGWVVFLVSVLLAILISFHWSFLLNCICFWTQDIAGFGDVAYYAVLLLSGLLVPIAFFPDWLQALSSWSPFPWMLNYPAELFTGRADNVAAWPVLLRQATWVLVLSIGCRWFLALGLRRMVIQGG